MKRGSGQVIERERLTDLITRRQNRQQSFQTRRVLLGQSAVLVYPDMGINKQQIRSVRPNSRISFVSLGRHESQLFARSARITNLGKNKG
jgi:hypothetical protein